MSSLKPVVVVAGVGRSGTSAVSRVLHEKMGVCMGHVFGSPNEGNPMGYYEDQESWRDTQVLLCGELTPKTWGDRVRRRHQSAGCQAELVGVKDPRLCMINLDMARMAGVVLIVLCKRDPSLVVQSLAKHLAGANPIEVLCARIIAMSDLERERRCAKAFRLTYVGLSVVDLTAFRTDEEIMAALAPGLEEATMIAKDWGAL